MKISFRFQVFHVICTGNLERAHEKVREIEQLTNTLRTEKAESPGMAHFTMGFGEDNEAL